MIDTVRSRPWLWCAIAAIITMGSYVTAMDGPFLWDDRPLILQSNLVQHLGSIPSYFTHGFWQSTKTTEQIATYYRPLTTLSYALDAKIHGTNAAGFHATNILLHAVNVALVFRLARSIPVDAVTAFVTALLFGLFPRLTEAVAWISGRTDVLATFFCLLAFLVWGESLARRVTASAFIFFGLCAKEVAFAAALGLAIFAFKKRKSFIDVLPVALSVVFYGWLRSSVITGRPDVVTLSTGERIVAVCEATGSYISMLALPFSSASQIGLLGEPRRWVVSLGAVAILSLGFVAIRYRSRMARASAFELGSAATCLFAMAVVLHIIPISVSVVAADRFLYLPVAFLVLCLARFFDRLRVFKVANLACIVCIGVFTAATIVRSGDYADEIRFWIHALDTSHPKDPVPSNELGNVYYRASMFEDAATLYTHARSLERMSIGTSLIAKNLANANAERGDYANAEKLWQFILASRPTADAFADLARLRLRQLDFNGAREAAGMALGQSPNDSSLRELTSRIESAEQAWSQRPDDDSTPSLYERAKLSSDLGRRTEATAFWTKLGLRPDAPPALQREACLRLLSSADLEASKPICERAKAGGDSAIGILLWEREDLRTRLVNARSHWKSRLPSP